MMCSKREKIVVGLLFVLIVECTSESDSNQKPKLNIAIIGAGTSGLASARYSIASGHSVTVFEQNADLGGVWAYTDAVGKNQYGVNIHSSMYEELRTNAPYQLMELPGHHYPNDTDQFPRHSDVLKYLHSYADRFDITKHIKFNHLVVRVLPLEEDKWEIVVKELPSDEFITKIFDIVFVCNGHFFAPSSPEIEDAQEFRGKLIHSHDFRTAEAFRDEDVLVVGMGASGIDLSMKLLDVAESVTVSVTNRSTLGQIPPEIIVREKVRRLTSNGAEFADGSKGSFTVVIYATGYSYSYPFLSVDSGIHVHNDFVQPLYKQIINIYHPTMAFIGIQKYVIVYHLYDIQAQFALKFLSGEKKLPSKAEMSRKYYETDRQFQLDWDIKKQGFEEFVSTQRQYLNELSALADIEKIPEVFNALSYDAVKVFFQHPIIVRKYKINVIDSEHFTKEWQGE
ncbi:senecionine N-oxygenase-like [Bradysia coprophila]|uniref:senecionine N-oxygenase-like n=1 Tax=Bradysia coprophila TaxID=38358 RepID=UPI00187DD46A|nr:senecionine N-oxygenase-like [Bradysia coprophila]